VIDGATNTVVDSIVLGDDPTVLCFNPTSNKLYASGAFADTVKVIDAATNAVIAEVRTGSDPRDLCWNRTSNRIYAACAGSDTVAVIDGASNAVVAGIPVVYAGRLCWNSVDNKIYCATQNGVDDSVVIINGATNAVIRKVRVGLYPRVMLYDSARNKVYCASWDDPTVTVISGSSDAVVATIPVGPRSMGLACSPAHNRVYVADRYRSMVSIIRDQSGAIEEPPIAEVRLPAAGPTIVRSVLVLGDRGRKTGDRVELLDVSGRRAMELRPGANDVRSIAPGVYFITERGNQRTVAARKVILQ